MRQQFDLPGISCEQCKGSLALKIETTGVKISILKIKCKQCGWEEDIFEKGNETYEAGKKRVKEEVHKIVKTLIKLKNPCLKTEKNGDRLSETLNILLLLFC